MKCRLCLKDKKLIKAHIIPDFMHQKLYDSEHKLLKVQYSKLGNSKKISTGEYDKDILCAECDNKISKYESYASKVIYGGSFLNEKMPNFQIMRNQFGLESTFITNVDYNEMKIFLLSILWRGSITKRSNYNDIALSSKDEEIIRQQILNEQAGEPFEFPCLLMTFLNIKDIHSDLIASPRRNLNNTRFTFLINGIIFTYFISDSDKPADLLNECIIKKNNTMRIMYLSEEKAKIFLNKFLGILLFNK